MRNPEVLLKAAGRIRRELCYGGSGHPFFAAIAAWLESVADDEFVQFDLINDEGWHALAVARAYLGGTA